MASIQPKADYEYEIYWNGDLTQLDSLDLTVW